MPTDTLTTPAPQPSQQDDQGQAAHRVERLAKIAWIAADAWLSDHMSSYWSKSWDDASEDEREVYRVETAAVLAAADGEREATRRALLSAYVDLSQAIEAPMTSAMYEAWGRLTVALHEWCADPSVPIAAALAQSIRAEPEVP